MKIITIVATFIFTLSIESTVAALTPRDDLIEHTENLRNFCSPNMGAIDLKYGDSDRDRCSDTIKEAKRWSQTQEGSKFLSAFPDDLALFEQDIKTAQENLKKAAI